MQIGLGIGIPFKRNVILSAFNPSSLFKNSEPGVWYDPSDIERYTAPLGPELVTNGDFSNGTTGWTFQVNATGVVVGGELQVTLSSTTSRGTYQDFSTVVGKAYRVTATVRSASGSLSVIAYTTGFAVIEQQQLTATGANQQFAFVFKATEATTRILVQQSATGSSATYFADNISVRELTAIGTATMFQDSSGTTPVTAVEQPVGLILDKSKGLVLGPELVTNGDFSNGTTGWTVNKGVVNFTGGVATFVPGADTAMRQSIALSAGKRYQVYFDLTDPGNFGVRVIFSGTATPIVQDFIGSGAKSALLPNDAANVRIEFDNINNNFSGTIDNISVRELPGNHATQTTATSRPVLSARYNLLTKTEQFDDAAWLKNNATVTANAAIAPDGTMTADRLVTGGVANTLKSVNQSFSAAAATYTSSIYVKDNGGMARSVDLFFATSGLSATVGTTYNFDTNTLTNIPSAGPFTLVSSSRTFVGNGWNRIEITITVSSAQSIQIYVAASYLAAQIGDYYIWGASLVPANQSSLPYQRVNTSTDYDSDPTKFPSYLKFDGVDDWLVTPTITPGTDKAQVFAGVRKLSDAAAFPVITELGVRPIAGSFTMGGTATANTATYHFASQGTSQVVPIGSGYVAPTTNVLTGIGDISGDSAILRVNGTQAASSTADQGTGNYLAYPLYIGRRGGTTLPFNGHLYGLIVRFGANLPAGTIDSTETWLNQKTGAY